VKRKKWRPAPGGEFDRFGRWRCTEWLEFVRTLPCECSDPRCPNCSPSGITPTHVVAAHLRSMAGIGAKPHDFLVYPLSDTIHRTFHVHGHPSVGWQLERVTRALKRGLQAGVIRIDHERDDGDIPY
jgi:hypothetical protein